LDLDASTIKQVLEPMVVVGYYGAFAPKTIFLQEVIKENSSLDRCGTWSGFASRHGIRSTIYFTSPGGMRPTPPANRF
jgi:hypothetical protein